MNPESPFSDKIKEKGITVVARIIYKTGEFVGRIFFGVGLGIAICIIFPMLWISTRAEDRKLRREERKAQRNYEEAKEMAPDDYNYPDFDGV